MSSPNNKIILSLELRTMLCVDAYKLWWRKHWWSLHGAYVHSCSIESCSVSPLRHCGWCSCRCHVRFNSKKEMFHKLKGKRNFQVLQHVLIKLLAIGWLYLQGQRTSNRINKRCSHLPPKRDNYKIYTFITRKTLNHLGIIIYFYFLSMISYVLVNMLPNITLKRTVIFADLIFKK